MDHLKQHIAALNQDIAAGVDVRFMLHGQWVPAIRTIVINEIDKCLNVWYRTRDQVYDQYTHIPVSTKFTTEFNDLPNDLRAAGWK